MRQVERGSEDLAGRYHGVFIKYIFAVTILFIVYNTFIPFRFYTEADSILRSIRQIEWMPFFADGEFSSLTDIAGNVLLFIPLGFFGFLYYLTDKNRSRAVTLTLLTGFLLSLSIETLQIFFRYRITSATDLITNSTGTIIGAVAASVYLTHLARRAEKILDQILRRQPLMLVLLIIIAVELFSSLLPFNVSITISDLKKSIANFNVVPFDMKPLGILLGFSHNYKRDLYFSRIGFVDNILFYILFGYLVWYVYYRYWRGERRKWLPVLFLLFYFPFLELLQFFIKSRFSDVNDIISGYLGTLAGSALFFTVKKESWFHESGHINTAHFTWPIFIYLILIVYKGCMPFEWSLNPAVIADDLKIHNLVPFYAYFKVTSLWNIYDILETFFLTMPMGFLLADRYKTHLHEKKLAIGVGLLGIALGLLIEINQVFQASRSGDITDVIFMGLGAWLGVLAYRYYYQNYESVDRPISPDSMMSGRMPHRPVD